MFSICHITFALLREREIMGKVIKSRKGILISNKNVFAPGHFLISVRLVWSCFVLKVLYYFAIETLRAF